MKLKDKVTVITGGAKGIGFAYARRFARDGAPVVIGDIADEAGAKAVKAIENAGGKALYVRCDVTKKAETEALFSAAMKRFGHVDIAIANAGIVHDAAFMDLAEKDFDRVMTVNVKGVFLTGQSAARAMIAGGKGGVIINITSTNAVVVQMGQVTYPVAKGAVNLLTKVELLPDFNLFVNLAVFVPGQYYKDFTGMNVGGKKFEKAFYNEDPASNVVATDLYLNSNNAYHVNVGFSFKF